MSVLTKIKLFKGLKKIKIHKKKIIFNKYIICIILLYYPKFNN